MFLKTSKHVVSIIEHVGEKIVLIREVGVFLICRIMVFCRIRVIYGTMAIFRIMVD